MDWIERLFGISPDGGNGLTELLIGVALALGVVVVAISANLFGIRARLRRVIRRIPRG